MPTASQKVVPIDSAERSLMRRDPEFFSSRQEWRERWIAAGQTCERCDDAASVVIDSTRLCGDCFLLATVHMERRDFGPRRPRRS